MDSLEQQLADYASIKAWIRGDKPAAKGKTWYRRTEIAFKVHPVKTIYALYDIGATRERCMRGLLVSGGMILMVLLARVGFPSDPVGMLIAQYVPFMILPVVSVCGIGLCLCLIHDK